MFNSKKTPQIAKFITAVYRITANRKNYLAKQKRLSTLKLGDWRLAVRKTNQAVDAKPSVVLDSAGVNLL